MISSDKIPPAGDGKKHLPSKQFKRFQKTANRTEVREFIEFAEGDNPQNPDELGYP